MKSTSKKEQLIIFAIISGLLVVSFYDVFFLGTTFKISASRPQALASGPFGQEDNVPPFMAAHNMESAYIDEPVHEFIKKSLWQGILPLWNPHQATGYPLIGMMQVGLFFPLNFILYIFPSIIAWDLMILARFLLAGTLTYWFMRCLQYEKIPSLGAGIAFMLSGPMVLFQYHTANDDLMALLVFIAIEKLIHKPNRRGLCFVGIAVALTFFAGHAEHVFLINLYGFLYFCFRVLTIRPRIDWKRPSQYLLSAYGLGIGLSSIVLFPFLRNWFTEFWNYHPPNIGLDAAWAPKSWVMAMFNPMIFKKALAPEIFIFSEWWGGYIGITVFALAFLGLWGKPKHKMNYFFGVMGFLIVSKSFGLPYINWIGYLPLFKLCNFHTHTYHLTAMTIAFLAGMGIDYALNNRPIFKRGLFYSVPLLLIFICYLIFFPKKGELTLSVPGFLFGCLVLTIFQIILWAKERELLKKKYLGILFVVLLFLESFVYIQQTRAGHPKRYDSFAKAPYIEYLNQSPDRVRSYGTLFTFFSNTGSGYLVDDFGIAMLVLPKNFIKFVNHFLIADYFEKKSGGRSSLEVTPITFFYDTKPYLDMLNVKYTVAPKQLPGMLRSMMQKPGSPQKVYSGKVDVYERPTAFPRAYIVHRAIFEPDEERSVQKIKAISNGFTQGIVIQHKKIPMILSQLKDVPILDRSLAHIHHYTPNRISIEVFMEHPGFLVLSDAYHPDWRATVGEAPAKIFKTNYLIRSVFLPSGRHQVEFLFEPLSFIYGRWVSLLAFGLLIGLWVRREDHDKQ